MSNLDKTRLVVTPLTNQISLARFGKDPTLALDRRNCESEFWDALINYAFKDMEIKSGRKVRIELGADDDKFVVEISKV